LGLSISKKIIEDHGGKLRLTKTSSNGATFENTLPSVATSDSGGLRPKIAPARAGIKRAGFTDKSPALANEQRD
jgi:hypothetical protein